MMVAQTKILTVKKSEMVQFWLYIERRDKKFADEWDVGCERKRGTKGYLKVFGLRI